MKTTIDGRRIAYTDEGRGTPVVLLHAFPLNRTMWAPQIEALAPHCRVIAVDLRGHGESDPVEASFTLDDFADDVQALLEQLQIQAAVLVGLSMGGYTLFAFYRRYAQRVRGLVLAGTKAQADTPEGRAARYQMIDLATAQGPGAIADAMLPRLLSPPSRTPSVSLADRVRDMILKTPVTTITGDLRAMAERPDSTSVLPRITCPTLVLVGQLDQGTPPTDARLIADGIPGATLDILPNAGHLSNLEQPDAFNRSLVEFLTRRC